MAERGDGGAHGPVDVVAVLSVTPGEDHEQGLGGGVVLDALAERGSLAVQLVLDERLGAVGRRDGRPRAAASGTPGSGSRA